MSKNLQYYLTFSHFEGIGPGRFRKLIEFYGGVETAYQASANEMNNVLQGPLGSAFAQFKKTFDPAKKLEEFRQKNITVITQGDENYPELLRHISDSPICLYVKGDLSGYDFKNNRFMAVVGTRKATSYGLRMTHQLTTELVGYGFVIVSGLAYGIDTMAHMAALEARGKTIAFLGCGVDIIYPWANHVLYNRMIESGGLIISEFPPGHSVLKGLFVARNRLISGSSNGVLVIEGTKKSGALITADYALTQGREVFALPAQISSPTSEAPHKLIKDGAKIVTRVEDILEELQVPAINPMVVKNLNLQGEEKLLYESLFIEPSLPDELAVNAELPVHQVLSLLSSLELQGIVEKNREGKYQLRP